MSETEKEVSGKERGREVENEKERESKKSV